MNTFSFDVSSHASSPGITTTFPRLVRSNYLSPGVEAPPPTAPDIHELTDQYGFAPQLARRRTKGIDDLILATRVGAAQSADNAAQGYSSRLQQLGFNPVSAGVVRAQVKRSGERPIADLTAQKDQMQYEARRDSATLAAQIANQIGSIRSAYSNTLADFNIRNAQLKQQNSQFNASTGLDVDKTNIATTQAEAELAARLAIASGGAGGAGGGSAGVGGDGADFYPGYITNSGPIIPGRKDGVTYPGFVFEHATGKYI